MSGWSVLVTGGAGYLGAHMALALQDAGHRVTVFDDFSRGHEDAVAGCEVVRGDVRSREDLRRCFEGRAFDLVMHFAGKAYVGESVGNPVDYYAINTGGTANLLEAMLAAGVRRMVFSSTCSTFGEPPSGQPIPEDLPQRPVNPYGHSKFMAERILRDSAAAYGLQCVTLRYFNAAGCDPAGRLGERHEPETHLIPLVLREALRVEAGGDPAATRLEVFGTRLGTPDGTCIRDYVHVTDLCDAHFLAGARLMQAQGGRFEAFNLGSATGSSVLEVIEACRRVTGLDLRFVAAPHRPGDPERLVALTGRARQELGWEPRHSDLETIVRTAWTWMRQDAWTRTAVGVPA